MDGAAAFTSDLRRVDWAAGFKPTGIEKYDGKTNPESWLTVYGLAIHTAGGDSKAMANYLPVALMDSSDGFTGYPVVRLDLGRSFVNTSSPTLRAPSDALDPV